jgi:hypothetical protein
MGLLAREAALNFIDGCLVAEIRGTVSPESPGTPAPADRSHGRASIEVAAGSRR